MNVPQLTKIFKKASKTHYYASLFFPVNVRQNVEQLYIFLRVVDDLVDADPSKREQYFQLKELYYFLNANLTYSLHLSKLDDQTKELILAFVMLKKEFQFHDEWVDAFFSSMEMDLDAFTYATIDETLRYTYGVAEVVGLMMSRLMGLDEKAYESAQQLGRAAQFINMIRDINEDIQLGRIYMPQEDLEKFSLSSLDEAYILKHRENFDHFIYFELQRFYEWLELARKGFTYIPGRYRIPILTIADIYEWTAKKIGEDPTIIYRKKVKPTKQRVITSALRNYIRV